MRIIVALISGTLFGFGLAVSGMTDTQKIIGFLDFFGDWDNTLLFVMIAALTVAIPGFYWLSKLEKPIFGSKFYWPKNTTINKKLIIGSVIFGVGWGLYGYCPGPAISSLVYLRADSVGFVIAMVGGMQLGNTILKRFG